MDPGAHWLIAIAVGCVVLCGYCVCVVRELNRIERDQNKEDR